MILYQYIAEALFFVFVLLVLFGALLAVRTRVMMHMVLGIAVCLLGVAGLYFYLGSMFLTLMQVLIYVGAICVVLVFGIMVGYTPSEAAAQKQWGKHPVLAGSMVASAFGLMVVAIAGGGWAPAAEKVGDFSLEYIGVNLLYTYCLAFELISVVLLIAIIGAIILARGTREGDAESGHFQGAAGPRTIRKEGAQ